VSCPYAHQQNGSAERKHRHIVVVGLSLLAHASMPLKYWDEAFLAATYLINRLPTKVLDFSSPLEILFKETPNYAGLRPFGCACWPNLRPFNTHKLQFRSKKCVFLGYSNLHKGFKCLNVAEGRVYISRDVIFDETVFPFHKLNPNAGARLRADILLLPSTSQGHATGDEFTDDPMTDMLIDPVATNHVCPAVASEKNLNQNNAGLNLGGQIQQRTAGTERGEADPLRVSGADCDADSCMPSTGSAALERSVRLRLSKRREATEPNADSTSTVSDSTGLVPGSSTAELGLLYHRYEIYLQYQIYRPMLRYQQ
jgi:hypothetical protein